MTGKFTRDRLVGFVAGFLAVSYGVGAPLAAVLEFQHQVFSARFGVSPLLVYLTSAVQFMSAVGVLIRPVASWGAAALTVTTLGAIAAHVRIGSPLTAGPAVAYTVLQIWFGLERWVPRAGRP
jgi:hypothetical protein